jgi:hypothetical protein
MGLMFISDRPAAIAEMRRTIVPGGRVVISTPGAIQPPFEILERALVEHIGADLGGFVRAVFSMHDPGAVASILRGADLRDVTATTKQAMLQLPAPAEFLWQYMGPGFPGAGLPDSGHATGAGSGWLEVRIRSGVSMPGNEGQPRRLSPRPIPACRARGSVPGVLAAAAQGSARGQPHH